MTNSFYRKIMVATDGSESVRKAVETAVEIAKISGAKLYVVYVIASEGFSITYPKNVGWEKAILEYFKAEARRPLLMSKPLGKLQMLRLNP